MADTMVFPKAMVFSFLLTQGGLLSLSTIHIWAGQLFVLGHFAVHWSLWTASLAELHPSDTNGNFSLHQAVATSHKWLVCGLTSDNPKCPRNGGRRRQGKNHLWLITAVLTKPCLWSGLHHSVNIYELYKRQLPFQLKRMNLHWLRLIMVVLFPFSDLGLHKSMQHNSDQGEVRKSLLKGPILVNFLSS
jgi:hypothetical protein